MLQSSFVFSKGLHIFFSEFVCILINVFDKKSFQFKASAIQCISNNPALTQRMHFISVIISFCGSGKLKLLFVVLLLASPVVSFKSNVIKTICKLLHILTLKKHFQNSCSSFFSSPLELFTSVRAKKNVFNS